MPAERGDQALFSKLFLRIVERFGDAVGVEDQRVSRKKLALANRAFPFFEDPDDCRGGVELFHGAVGPQKQGGQMAAIYVSKPAGLVVVFGKQERSVGA